MDRMGGLFAPHPSSVQRKEVSRRLKQSRPRRVKPYSENHIQMFWCVTKTWLIINVALIKEAYHV